MVVVGCSGRSAAPKCLVLGKDETIEALCSWEPEFMVPVAVNVIVIVVVNAIKVN